MGFSPIGPSHTYMYGRKDVGHAERGAGSIHDTMEKAKACITAGTFALRW